jgi:hypothetical protein
MTDFRHSDPLRVSLLASALRVSWATIAWNGTAGSLALVVAVLTNSLALAGFALNALLDSSASIVLVWRFRRERSDPEAAEHLERRAQGFVIAAMAVVAAYVGLQAIRALTNGSHAEASARGVLLAATSLVVLPWLRSPKVQDRGEAAQCRAARRRRPDDGRGSAGGDHSCRAVCNVDTRLVVGRSGGGDGNRGCPRDGGRARSHSASLRVGPISSACTEGSTTRPGSALDDRALRRSAAISARSGAGDWPRCRKGASPPAPVLSPCHADAPRGEGGAPVRVWFILARTRAHA